MRRFWSIRTYLFALVGSIALPFIAILFYSIVPDIRDDEVKAHETVFSLADLTAIYVQQFITTCENILSKTAQQSLVQEMKSKRIDSVLKDLSELEPWCKNLILADKSGQVLFSAAPQTGMLGSVAGTDWFKGVVSTRRFSMGSSIPDPINKELVSGMGYPVIKNGTLVGVLGMFVDLRHFQNSFKNLALPKSATITICDQNGIIISRSLNSEKWIGQSSRGIEIGDIALTQTRGTTQAQGVDGENRFYGFTAISDSGWRVYAGISTRTALAATQASAIYKIVGAIGITCFVILLAVLLGRRIASPILQLAEVTRSATKGSLKERVLVQGPEEIVRVSTQFNEMMDARVLVEKDLNKANDRLKALSHNLFRAQEIERRAIARELHDEIGQALTAIKINLQALGRFPDANTLNARLEDGVKIVDRTLQQVRDLSLDLRPQLLDDLGLVSALRWYLQEQAKRANLRIHFSTDPFGRLESTLETACFRVVQEAITNVIRHSQAQMITVETRLRDNAIHLYVRDDGIGFDPIAVREASSGSKMGLCGMEERVLLVGGQIIVNSKPRHGTEVHAWFSFFGSLYPSDA
jgi:signal transduction histidine kinase